MDMHRVVLPVFNDGMEEACGAESDFLTVYPHGGKLWRTAYSHGAVPEADDLQVLAYAYSERGGDIDDVDGQIVVAAENARGQLQCGQEFGEAFCPEHSAQIQFPVGRKRVVVAKIQNP